MREAAGIAAVKKFRDTVTDNAELKNRPELEGLRKGRLKEPLEFFQQTPRSESSRPTRDTPPDALSSLAAANFDLASLTSEIGSIPDSIRSYSESLAIREPPRASDHGPHRSNRIRTI